MAAIETLFLYNSKTINRNNPYRLLLPDKTSQFYCVCMCVCVSKRERGRERQRGMSALLGSIGFNATLKTICTQYEDDKSQRQFEPRRGPAADKSNFLL